MNMEEIQIKKAREQAEDECYEFENVHKILGSRYIKNDSAENWMNIGGSCIDDYPEGWEEIKNVRNQTIKDFAMGRVVVTAIINIER